MLVKEGGLVTCAWEHQCMGWAREAKGLKVASLYKDGCDMLWHSDMKVRVVLSVDVPKDCEQHSIEDWTRNNLKRVTHSHGLIFVYPLKNWVKGAGRPRAFLRRGGLQCFKSRGTRGSISTEPWIRLDQLVAADGTYWLWFWSHRKTAWSWSIVLDSLRSQMRYPLYNVVHCRNTVAFARL